MTRQERSKVIKQMWRTIAVELDSHFENGSDFIFFEPNGSESPDHIVRIRSKVLRSAIAHAKKRGAP